MRLPARTPVGLGVDVLAAVLRYSARRLARRLNLDKLGRSL
jgi:hypothetical protein